MNMNQPLTQMLRSLDNVLASPQLRQVEDAQAKAQLRQAQAIAAYLVSEVTVMPASRQQALRECAALVPGLVALGDDAASADAVRRLQQIADDVTHDEVTRFDAAMALLRELQLALQGMAIPAAAALQRQVLAIESNHCRRVEAALASHAAQAALPEPAEQATHARSFDAARLRDFIIRTFPQEKEIRIVGSKFLQGGNSKYTLLITLDGVKSLPREIVLRGDTPSSAHYGGGSILDEFRLLEIVHAHGVCAPKPLALEASGDVFGSPFILLEKRPGSTIGHMYDFPPPNMATCRDIAAKLAPIHCIPPSAIGDWIKGATIPTSQQVATILDESYASWQALQQPSPVFEAAFAWLRANTTIMDGTRGLVHGDYGLNNLLIDGDHVSSVLDWEYGHIANPAYDLGYFYFQAEGIGSWQQFLQAYEQAGATLPTKAELDYSILFSTTRLGVQVAQGIAAYASGQTSGMMLALLQARRCNEITITRLTRLLDGVL